MLNYFALTLLRFYKFFVSPLLRACGFECRFFPTCSDYARLSFENESFFRACFKSTRRLCSCHPFNPGGIDLP